jgi:hypothetical protein
VVFVVRDPELAPDDLGDACARPQLAAEAVRLGPVGQELREQPELPRLELRRGTEVWAGAQCLLSFFSGARHPLADGAFGHGEGFGDLVVRPAIALEVEGAPPALLLPVKGPSVLHCHARTLITRRQV